MFALIIIAVVFPAIFLAVVVNTVRSQVKQGRANAEHKAQVAQWAKQQHEARVQRLMA